MKKAFLILEILLLIGCSAGNPSKSNNEENGEKTSVFEKIFKKKEIPFVERVVIKKDLTYDKHTLADTFPYNDTIRVFQWHKIKYGLALIDSMQSEPVLWGVLENYKNLNGKAPLVRRHIQDDYDRPADSLGVQQYQSAPLYLLTDTLVPELYGRDGSLVKVMDTIGSFNKVSPVCILGEWLVPDNYMKVLNDSVVFSKAIFVDRTNQNIATLEKVDSVWYVRSMNPATTGRRNPPYQYDTPIGIFVIQEKKEKMIYLKDGSYETGGFAPYASRFCNGGYIHGVPVNEPNTKLIEFSPTLGTIPRSHMCVRNATSHAKFIYDWSPTENSIVFVID